MTAGRLAAVAVFGLVLLLGCDQLTRERFDLVRIGHAQRFDVEQMLGQASYPEIDNMWHYERVERHLNALIYFDEAGRVCRKEWHDSLAGVHYDSAEPWDDDAAVYESTTVRQIH